jgi:hypothetical protein
MLYPFMYRSNNTEPGLISAPGVGLLISILSSTIDFCDISDVFITEMVAPVSIKNVHIQLLYNLKLTVGPDLVLILYMNFTFLLAKSLLSMGLLSMGLLSMGSPKILKLLLLVEVFSPPKCNISLRLGPLPGYLWGGHCSFPSGLRLL